MNDIQISIYTKGIKSISSSFIGIEVLKTIIKPSSQSELKKVIDSLIENNVIQAVKNLLKPIKYFEFIQDIES